MSEWFWNIIIAVISGLTTTISAALLLWIFNLVRNQWLKNKIKKVICKNSHLCGLMESFATKKMKYAGVVIKNTSAVFLTIRAVWAEAGKEGNYSLFPMTYIGPYFQKDINPFSYAPEQKNMYGFIELSPFTNGQWILSEEELINCQDTTINRLQVYVEFQTFFKNPKVISVIIKKPEVLDYLNKMLAEVSEKTDAVVKN
jgi:hypothetical protein